MGVAATLFNTWSRQSIEGVQFLAANTDAQALRRNGADVTVAAWGRNYQKGLGAGANPEIGRLAAEENREEIARYLEGADMVFYRGRAHGRWYWNWCGTHCG